MSAAGETFVVRAGPLRVLLLGPLLLFAGLLFLFLALVALFIDVDNWLGKLTLWLLALGLALLGLYFLLLLTVLAMRVEVGPDAVSVRVPNWRSVLPWFPWIRTRIPYADIAGVETREEVYSSLGLTSLQTAHSLVTKDKQRIVFGYSSPQAAWGYPLPEAAAAIASRAGASVIDRGAVAVGGVSRALLKGMPSWDAPSLSPEQRAAAQGRAARAMQIAFALVAIAVAVRACMPHD